MAKKKSNNSEVQAVLFKKKKWTTNEARKWLDDNNYKRMKKVDITENLYRYRITDPKQYSSFITKKLKKGVLLVIGFK